MRHDLISDKANLICGFMARPLSEYEWNFGMWSLWIHRKPKIWVSRLNSRATPEIWSLQWVKGGYVGFKDKMWQTESWMHIRLQCAWIELKASCRILLLPPAVCWHTLLCMSLRFSLRVTSLQTGAENPSIWRADMEAVIPLWEQPVWWSSATDEETHARVNNCFTRKMWNCVWLTKQLNLKAQTEYM